MTKETLKPFDPADYLKSDEAIAEYLTAALETEDAALIADALEIRRRDRKSRPEEQPARSPYTPSRQALCPPR